MKSFNLEISATGYQTQTYAITVDSFGEVANDFVLPLFVAPDPLITSSTLSGVITDNKTGLPIENVDVSVGLSTVKTDSLGQYSVSGISTLDFSTVITAANYTTISLNAKTTAFGLYTLNQALIPVSTQDTKELTTDTVDPLRTTSQLTGVITDKITNLPIANADISLNGSVVASANAQGVYTISSITALDINLSISALDYKTKMLNVKFSGYGDFVVNQTLDSTSTPAVSTFQVLNVYALQPSVKADTTLRFKATIANLNNSIQNSLIIAEVINAKGQSVTKVLPYAPNTTTQQANISFNASETLTLDFDWDVKQAPIGNYQLVVRAIIPGSINGDNVIGTILAEAGNYVKVLSTKAVNGVTNFDPVLVQTGTTIPVKLAALVINQGNENLASASFTLSIIDPSTSNIIYSTQAVIESLKVQNNQLLDFGGWLPTASGDLIVSVVPDDISVSGSINGKLYVGDKATGIFSISQPYVPEGSPTIQAKINLQGVDTKTGTSTDPLFFAVKNAVEKGANYVGPNAIDWHKTNQCLGCHIQSQSFNGLGSSLDKADISLKDTAFLFNSLVTSQQKNGGIYLSFPQYVKTQTSLALWSLATFPDKSKTIRAMYDASRLLFDKKVTNGSETYWDYDHPTGYVAQQSNISALVTMGMSNLIRAKRDLIPNTVTEYKQNKYTILSSGINRPFDLELGGDNALYIAKRSGSVERLDLTTNALKTVALTPYNTFGLAISDDGTIYAGGANFIQKINPDGTQTRFLDYIGYIRDIEMGPDGLLYVSDSSNNRLIRVDLTGQVEILVDKGLLSNPRGLSFDKLGNLFISNADTRNILKMSPDKTVTVYADGLGAYPQWLDVADNGLVYVSVVTGTGNSGVLQISPDGFAIRKYNHTGVRLSGVAFNSATSGMYIIDDFLNSLTEVNLQPIDLPLLSSYENELPKMARYFLNRYTVNSNDNAIHALRMSALAELKLTLTDPSLLAEIETALNFEENLLRSRQLSDGGWPK